MSIQSVPTRKAVYAMDMRGSSLPVTTVQFCADEEPDAVCIFLKISAENMCLTHCLGMTSYTLHSFHHFPSTHLTNHVRSVSTRQKCDHEENLGKQEDSVYEPRIKTFHLPSQLRRRLLLHGRTELTWKIPKRYGVKTWPNKVQTSWKSTREKNHRRWWWKQTRSCHHELETLLRADSHPVRLW